MVAFSPEAFLFTLALIGTVIMVAGLLSGFVERSGLPQVAVFLALGAIIGPAGLNMADVGVDSPILRVVSTLSLVLVLFTDAVSLDLKEVREHRWLAFLVLGPGTLFSAVLIAGAGHLLLGLSVPLAAMLGASLASTDPVLLRGLLRQPSLPSSVRQALRLESGMNDVVLLPIVLVTVALGGGGHMLTGKDMASLGIKMLLLSPGAGALVALVAIAALELIRRRMGVRRDYESIYSLGVALAAYAAAEAIHGSGFLAAFAAGLTISALDVELCDCFLEYGETTAEMALLFAFVLFGTSVIWTGLTIASPITLGFTALVLLLRPVAFVPALLPSRIAWRDRGLIAWFGPRGLSSLLLILLPVFASVPGSQDLLTICCLVVLCSIVIHGLSPMVLLRKPRNVGPVTPEMTQSAAVPTEDTATADANAAVCSLACPLPNSTAKANRELLDPEYLSLDELDQLTRAGVPVNVVDSRTERTYNESTNEIPGAVRLHPDHAVLDAERHQLSRDLVLAVLCT
jgi:NhaP-type Na+/H+ or K+/H+ antiporter